MTDSDTAAQMEFFLNYIGQRLSHVDVQRAKRLAKAMVGSDGLGLGIEQMGEAIEPVLLAPTWDWPEFDYWRERFRELGAFPAMWSDLSGLPVGVDQTTQAVLTCWIRLSVPARAILASRPWPMPVAELGERSRLAGHDLERILAELEREGFARRLRSAAERLEVLKLNELRAIARRAGVRLSGKKAEVVARLRMSLSEPELRSLLPLRACDCDGAIVSFPEEVGPWVTYQRARLWLFAHTATLAWLSDRNRRSYIDAGIARMGFQILGQQDDPCPVCPEHHRQRFDDASAVRPEDLPPLHPGCRCAIAAWMRD
jgi:hypothetical protein